MSSLQDYPLQPPPPGTLPNFKDPESRGPAITAVCYTFVVLMWPIFLLRLYSKAWVLRKFGWDDVSAILAAVGITGFAASVIWLIDIRFMGPHAWDVRAVVLTSNVARVYVLGSGGIPFSLTMFFAKLALFLLYYRIFAANSRAKFAISFGILVNCLFYIACTIAVIILCLPRRHEGWMSTSYAARCTPASKIGNVQGVYGVISDLYIFILPLPVLWNLQMPLRKKLGITAIFFTGLIAIIASSLGLYYRILESSDPDLSWNDPPALGLAVVEASIGVICGSVPHLPALFRGHTPNLSSIGSWLNGWLSSWRTSSKKSYDSPLDDFSGSHSKANKPQRMQVETHVLGSMQGDGQFITSGKFSKIWDAQPSTEHLGTATRLGDADPTARNHYEAPTTTTTQAVSHNNKTSPTQRTRTSSRKGYWDIMSTFRSGNSNSRSQSEHLP